ncbi:WD40-repeat-containing domain protein [Scheffersomyces amazonensis]|uniref:WD40-repeat-containing domain protein n=1 Tax=Scheffersomyces amazonensis TaxID=1078765 RepID=UPI00315CB130
MKIKTISRSADQYVPVRNTQESSLPRNLNPALHPFERAREYTKAVTATKLERMFAQPFIGQLGDGHRDGVYCIAKNFGTTNQVASGSGDGIIKYWDMTSRQETVTFKAHYGLVTGLSVTPGKTHMLSCGDDKYIKLWSVNYNEFDAGFGEEDVYDKKSQGLVKTFLGEHAFKGLDHHFNEDIFVTGGLSIQLWDMNRSKYVSDLSWGADNINTVKFNKTETNIIASAGSDNSIVLYDIRTNTAIQKVVTNLRTNCISWNPMEAFNFASGSDDHNAYLWDMRNLNKSLNVYKDHVAGIMDIDFSPTGEELVTGSYDKTIRIFRSREGHSRDIYHTKRMQRIFCVKYTTDARYILSGSDDTNVRIWRANSSDRAGIKSSRQRAKMEYDNALKERFKHMPEIKRISRHRHVPIVIKKANEIKRVELESLKKRQENDRKHSRAGSKPYVPERQKHIRGTAIKEDK